MSVRIDLSQLRLTPWKGLQVLGLVSLLPVLGVPCSSSSSAPAETAEQPAEAISTPEAEAEMDSDENSSAQTSSSERAKEAPAAEPLFRDGMTIEEARAVVPPDTAFIRIEPEALTVPLQGEDIFAQCELKSSQKFTAHLGIWDGRAVAIELQGLPEGETRECVLRELRTLEWRDRVKSFNDIKYSF